MPRGITFANCLSNRRRTADNLFGALSEMSSLDWKEIEIRYRGKPVKGRYNVSDNLVTVAAWNGTKTAQLVAQMLLRELAA